MRTVRHFLPFLFALLLLAQCRTAPPLQTAPPTSMIPIADGWARNSINTVIFRRNALVSHKGMQYLAFYDPEGRVVLARRRLGTADWETKTTPYSGHVEDAHNAISLMVDGRGYLHLSWDHHNNALRYCRSVEPNSLELTEMMPMVGMQEARVSYPEFHRLLNGDLIFAYRDGASGQGNLILNRYDATHQTWSRLHDVLIDGEGQRNAYWQMKVDEQNQLHLSWVWRETNDVASNHDMAYAKSSDGGVTWQKSTGEAYQLPITETSAEYAWRIPQNSELINQTAMTADLDGRPYIATYWRDAQDSIPQYRVIYHNGTAWQQSQVSQRTTPFSLSGAGTKRIPISRPQLVIDDDHTVYVVFRDAERGDRVSLAASVSLAENEWAVRDLTETSVGQWEPCYDTELWAAQRVLHLFLQKTGQGDGETLDDLPPQPVSVLEWTPALTPLEISPAVLPTEP
ncbi:BNR repeat-containing family member [Catalinimonas alkaloidigena]|uniref:BNR repeat-containing family member n=1 Tax=Catalinimonas alkaloidigena TaxID=1075417 RepID=A0A1G9H5E0_9BACT|nr:BNR repeat-containing protein [Catalinimonas alkaloidigena]SDL08167.1 BNR repeat-containing family member [Catalinimonas alkaloidigena]